MTFALNVYERNLQNTLKLHRRKFYVHSVRFCNMKDVHIDVS